MGFKCGIVGLPNVGKSTLFNALTQTAAAQAANYPFCTIEPNVGEIAVPDSRLEKLSAHRGIGKDHSDADHLRRYRRAGPRRVEGRGSRQPVPRHHPRGRRHRTRGALLRRSRRHPRRRQDRPDRRHRHDRDRADACRSRQPGKARRQPGEEGEGQRRGRQGGEGDAGSGPALAGLAARGQAGAAGRAQVRRGKAVPFARPAHLAAVLYACNVDEAPRRPATTSRARSRSAPRRKAPFAWSSRPRSSPRSPRCRRTSARNSWRRRLEGSRPGSPDPRRLRAASTW